MKSYISHLSRKRSHAFTYGVLRHIKTGSGHIVVAFVYSTRQYSKTHTDVQTTQ